MSPLTADAQRRRRAGAHRGHALQPGALDRSAPPTEHPRMRRWEPLVRRIVRGDPEAFSLLMAFILVESGGYQFAVSRTGCIGLLQFCSRSALRPPFDAIFAIDGLRRCRCRRGCRIAWSTRRFLETTDPALHPIVASEFPCALSDPRFDPEQAIRAGWAYVGQLSTTFGGNVYLAYIGYNSGPPAAARVWRALGADGALRLDAIGRVLGRALAPEFGRQAGRRARVLLRYHLPKLARVRQLYQQAEGGGAATLPLYHAGADACAVRPAPCQTRVP